MTDTERANLKSRYPFAYAYFFDDDFYENPDRITREMIAIRKNEPELWDKVEDDEFLISSCPPRTQEMTEDELEFLCFGGCRLCWKDCERDNFEHFLGGFRK